MEIKTLFDDRRDIYRKIEKVITYGVSQEDRLRSEIAEYVVTESIESQFERLLSNMQSAMESGGQNEVGVWVSGFYGSGKSSLTKYLGLALDDQQTIDGVPFIQHLQDRFHRSTTKALLSSVAKKFPAGVCMFSLASNQLAGATQKEVSTVLYYKVLQWAGYSENLKVALLERRLKKEDRYDEFEVLFAEITGGLSWAEYRNDQLVIDGTIPEIAHRLYPQLFTSASSFNTAQSEVIQFEEDRVKEMIDIAREATGRDYIIFIIDEVGQYVGSRSSLILNLDGLAINLKNIGDGKVWIFGTGQQTLTEDDPSASLNSPELYKLKDRFPIQIDLEASDIKEICYNRLLAKSAAGKAELETLFDNYGQGLRNHTKLVDARAYGADFDKQTFVNLYPFLPAQFDILLHLLGALAKSTGGVGLRSAIKVIQDILIEGADGQTPIANQPVGWIATTVTLFDALKKDIEKGYASTYQSAYKAQLRFHESQLHQDIAKTVCVLQILGNIPISLQNVTSLMHGGVASPSRADEVKAAVDELINDPIVPFGEREGNLCFFSEKLNDIEQERASLPLRQVELKRIQNEALKEAYSPLPAITLHGSLAVATGLKAASLGTPVSINGDRNQVQTLVEYISPTDYETAKNRLVDESRQNSAKNQIFAIGRTNTDIDDLVNDIYRCREIASKYRSDPDQEVKEYCASQTDIANRKLNELQGLLKRSLVQGSLIFRGEVTAVDSLDLDLLTAAKKHLTAVAEEVFNRFAEAPHRANTNLAEKFLNTGLQGITAETDPLGLVQRSGGTPSIDTSHKALNSIKDRIEREGSLDGKRLTDLFTDAPFGWSPDTLRYLVAALFVAGEIKLRVSGREITAVGQLSLDALKSNNSFKSTGVSLRDERPSMELLGTAASRLTQLSGETVIPLEPNVVKAAAKLFPSLQHQYSPLGEKLLRLGLPGTDKVETLSSDIKDLLANDASDAPIRLGTSESSLYTNLEWASGVVKAFAQGLEQTINEINSHNTAIEAFPQGALSDELKNELDDAVDRTRSLLDELDFYKKTADIASELTHIKSRVRDAAIQLQGDHNNLLNDAKDELVSMNEWGELIQSHQSNVLNAIEEQSLTASQDLEGLKQLIARGYGLQTTLAAQKRHIQEIVQAQRQKAIEEEQAQGGAGEPRITVTRTLAASPLITSIEELDRLINELRKLRGELNYAHEFELTITQTLKSDDE